MKNQKDNKQLEACLLTEPWKVAFVLAEVQRAGWQHYPILIDIDCFWLTQLDKIDLRGLLLVVEFYILYLLGLFLRIGLEITPTKTLLVVTKLSAFY